MLISRDTPFIDLVLRLITGTYQQSLPARAGVEPGIEGGKTQLKNHESTNHQ